MHRTVNGFVIITIVAFGTLRALLTASASAASAPTLVTLSLLLVASLGAFAVRAMLKDATSARTLVTAWAMSVLGYVVASDMVMGFLRPGVGERLLATSLVAALLAVVVLSVPTRELRNDAHGAALA